VEANTRNRTLALAALLHNINGVNQIANRGYVDTDVLAASINSILSDNVDSIEDLYGGLDNLKTGLQALLNQLGASTLAQDGRPRDMEATRYSVSLFHLEHKLNNQPDVFKTLLSGIEDAQRQLEFFEPTHENMISRLAELYTQTISKIGPRIIIKGEQQYLANPENAARIRVLLLAGIRAALLWRQAGGTRWKLLFSRGKIQTETELLLKHL